MKMRFVCITHKNKNKLYFFLGDKGFANFVSSIQDCFVRLFQFLLLGVRLHKSIIPKT